MNEIKNISNYVGKSVEIEGWVRNHRRQSKMGFIEVFDGSTVNSVQIVYESCAVDNSVIQIHAGDCIEVKGKVLLNGNTNAPEVFADWVHVLAECQLSYPIQPKKHSLEFLREQAPLRTRTKVFQSVFRIRSFLTMAIHKYFQEQGYICIQTPIVSGSDAEGAGNTFSVSTDSTEGEFFGKPVSLAVTGQLEAEAFAMGFSKVYSFGPSFRAENSNTKTHASEFWMVEPEIAFTDLNGLMTIEENLLKSILGGVLDRCKDEIEFLSKFNGVDLEKRILGVLNSDIAKVSYRNAVSILREAQKEETFEFLPCYGEDLAKEHEDYLTKYYGGPVFIYDWPKNIKAFYMHQNDDNETVAAVDLIVPQAGELMGGSQREVRYDVLRSRMKELGMKSKELEWYIDLRKYGCPTHSGFGMGFDRLLIYVTGMSNIRDVIPFPRTPRNCNF